MDMQRLRRNLRGFTLVEIAIVLVIIGLLIGGVLRASELLNASRASTIVTQQTSMQTAFYGFVDRFKMLPGDLTAVQSLLINSNTAPASSPGDGNVLLADSPAFFNNLAQAGFIVCAACTSTAVVTPGVMGATPTAGTYLPPLAGLTASNSPVNVYGQAMAFYFNTGTTAGSIPAIGGSTAGSITFLGTASEGGKPLLLTGAGIYSSMLAEIDRKSDDGSPGNGQLRYTDITASTSTSGPSIFVNATTSGSCFTGAAAPFAWAVNPAGTCQGASML